MSQHLAALYRAGVLARRRDATQIYYRIGSRRAATLCRAVCMQIAVDLDDAAAAAPAPGTADTGLTPTAGGAALTAARPLRSRTTSQPARRQLRDGCVVARGGLVEQPGARTPAAAAIRATRPAPQRCRPCAAGRGAGRPAHGRGWRPQSTPLRRRSSRLRGRRRPGVPPIACVAAVLWACASSSASSAPCSAASGARRAATSGTTAAALRWRCASSTLAQAWTICVRSATSRLCAPSTQNTSTAASAIAVICCQVTAPVGPARPTAGATVAARPHRAGQRAGASGHRRRCVQGPGCAAVRTGLRPGRARPTSATSAPPARPGRGRAACRC